MSLGKNGQLGNQMFQYATLYGLGFLRGIKIKIPTTGHDLIEAFPNLSAVLDDAPVTGRQYQEPSFLFDPPIKYNPIFFIGFPKATASLHILLKSIFLFRLISIYKLFRKLHLKVYLE